MLSLTPQWVVPWARHSPARRPEQAGLSSNPRNKKKAELGRGRLTDGQMEAVRTDGGVLDAVAWPVLCASCGAGWPSCVSAVGRGAGSMRQCVSAKARRSRPEGCRCGHRAVTMTTNETGEGCWEAEMVRKVETLTARGLTDGRSCVAGKGEARRGRRRAPARLRPFLSLEARTETSCGVESGEGWPVGSRRSALGCARASGPGVYSSARPLWEDGTESRRGGRGRKPRVVTAPDGELPALQLASGTHPKVTASPRSIEECGTGSCTYGVKGASKARSGQGENK